MADQKQVLQEHEPTLSCLLSWIAECFAYRRQRMDDGNWYKFRVYFKWDNVGKGWMYAHPALYKREDLDKEGLDDWDPQDS